jgi:hypothetical protein
VGGGEADGDEKVLALLLLRSDAAIGDLVGPHGDVEIAFVDDKVAVRDSKNPDGGALIFGAGTWSAFIAGVSRDEFVRP